MTQDLLFTIPKHLGRGEEYPEHLTEDKPQQTTAHHVHRRVEVIQPQPPGSAAARLHCLCRRKQFRAKIWFQAERHDLIHLCHLATAG